MSRNGGISIHELPIMRGVYALIMRNPELNETKKLVSVTLRVGEIRDLLDSLVQMYWDYITKGTPAEGSAVKINTVPATCRCTQCREIYPVRIMEIDKLCCPRCGSDQAGLLTGHELEIEEIEVRTVKFTGKEVNEND